MSGASVDHAIEPPTRVGRSHGRRWLIGLALVAGAGAVWYSTSRKGASGNGAAASGGAPAGGAGRLTPVVVATARTGDLSLSRSGIGTVTPFHTVVVRSRVDGALDKVLFTEGSLVNAGDPIAEIDPRQFKAQLAQAVGQAARDEALLANAKADLERAVAGEAAMPAQRVTNARALVRQYEGSLMAGEGQLEKDRALLVSAKSDLDRYQAAGAAVSPQQLVSAQALVRQYEGAVKSDEGQIGRDRSLLENAKADVVRLAAAEGAVPAQEVLTAKAAVAQYEGALTADRAQVDQAQLLVDYANIKAPISGRIGFRRVDAGNMVHASDPEGIAVITETAPIAVIFSLPQDDLPSIQRLLAREKEPAVEAFDRDLRRKLAVGTLLTLDNQIDARTGTFRLKAKFLNADGALFPNQFVNVRVGVESRKDAVIVPVAAVQRGPAGAFVYVVKADQTIETKPVTPRESEGGEIAITSGLAGGEVVVTDGVDKIQAGSKVVVRARGEPDAAKSKGATRGTPAPAAETDSTKAKPGS